VSAVTPPSALSLAAERLSRLGLTLLAAAAGAIVCTLLAIPALRMLLTAGSSGGSVKLVLAPLAQTSTVYAADGSVLASLHATQNRIPVTYAQVPPAVVNAVVDTEDATFWYDHGVNVEAVIRSALADTSNGGIVQGASTITMQLVKNTFLNDQRSATNKLKEAALALRIEGQMTKQQILGQYLNTIYFGNGAYGIGAAAETYFGVPVEQLTTAQGALLAGLISDPIGYDPFTDPLGARARRDFVLDRMATNHSITQAQAEALKSTPLPTKATSLAPPPDGQDGYFVEAVTQRLLADTALGSTYQARYNAVFGGGLRIYTTLDPAAQDDAEIAVANNLPDNHGQWTAALVAVDPSTGAVRALVGGPGFNNSQYDIATDGPGRQPGSSFKPIVLAAALQQGYSINATVNGTSPCTFPIKGAPAYVAHNNEGEGGGWMPLSRALALSLNCAYARLGDDVGLANVVTMAKAMGITTPLSPYLSMSIGSEDARPIDMAGVYATIDDNGVHHTPFMVTKVTDSRGHVLETGGSPGTQVITPQQAHEEIAAMRQVMQYGTGTTANLSDRPVAGKTGTTDNYTNAWFDGFSPQLATVVWMGSPSGDVPMTSVGGMTATGQFEYDRAVYGATYPSMIWHQFMESALAAQPAVDFPAPDPYAMGSIFYVKDPTVGGGYGPNGGYGYGYGRGSGSYVRRGSYGGATSTRRPPATSAPVTVPVTAPTPTTRAGNGQGGPSG